MSAYTTAMNDSTEAIEARLVPVAHSFTTYIENMLEAKKVSDRPHALDDALGARVIANRIIGRLRELGAGLLVDLIQDNAPAKSYRVDATWVAEHQSKVASLVP